MSTAANQADGSADPRRGEAARAIGAAWLAFMAGLLVGGEVRGPTSFAIGGALGAVLVLVGFAAAWRCRPLSPDPSRRPERFAVLALAIGMGLGLANLAANWLIAQADPGIRTLLADRMASIGLLEAVVAAPLIEEVTIRLFLMSAIAWIVLRLTKRATLAFGIALVGSALVFALLHLGRPLPADLVLANFYRATLVLKYTLAALPLGWIFWRWGLPYAILCHAAANGAHLAVQGVIFYG